ncbi:RecT family recombinase [Cupriavidus sp. amp6]|uniref:RecT family recombinase n=1 Tax=Cupriavidus sp. amp6 TaxID=388051 RepID=UPI0018DB4CAC|nr:RecT family recombinase [Cupriavidus sp. amp6]
MTAIQTMDRTQQPGAPGLSSTSMLLDVATIESISRVADIMASGRATIPQHLRGNQGDCFAVTMQAMQWEMNPFAVAQKTHISQSGALGYEAQLINAVVIARAPIIARPDYEFIGDWNKVLGKVEERKSEKGGKYYVATYTKADEEGLGVICRATIVGEPEPREVKVMMSQCYPRFSTQWATDPQQQITYVAIRKWARRHAPDVLLGVSTPDELDGFEQPAVERDMGKVEDVRKEEPAPASRASRVKDKLHSRAAQATDVKATDVATGAPGLDEVLGAIGAATNGAELTAAGQMASKMPDGPEKDRARKAYQDKLQAGKAATAAPTPTEHAPAVQAPAVEQEDALTFAQVMDALQQATTVEALNLAADLIRYVPDMVQQDELRAEFERLKKGDN